MVASLTSGCCLNLSLKISQFPLIDLKLKYILHTSSYILETWKTLKSFVEQTHCFFSLQLFSHCLFSQVVKRRNAGKLGLNLAMTSADEHPADEKCVPSRCHHVWFSLSWSSSGAAS